MNAVKVAPTTSPKKPAYTVREAADYWGVSTKSIRRLIDRGLLKKSKALGKILIPGESLESLVDRTL